MGIIAEIYRAPLMDGCANGGISERVEAVTVVDIDGPFEPTPDRPAVRLVRRHYVGTDFVHAEPVEPVEAGRIGYMSGGSFIHSCDSRFSDAVGAVGRPISLHDRTETPTEYAALSS